MTRRIRRIRAQDTPATPEIAELNIVALDQGGSGLATVSATAPGHPADHEVPAVAPRSLPCPPPGQPGGPGDTRPINVTITVPFTIPGERVRARVWRRQRGPDGADVSGAADLLEVLAAAPDRVEPACPLFGTCGGCQLQHLAYPRQLDWKTTVVRELVAPLGLDHLVAPCVGSPRVFGYRSKITPHHDRPRAGESLAIGFLKVGRKHQVVDVPRCPLATDGINERLPELRAEIAATAPLGRLGASFLIREASSGVTTDPDARVTERVGDLELEFFAREFFQNNPFLLPRLVDFVVEAAAAGGAPVLVDTYTGSGLFALAAARRFSSVVGVEVSPGAVRAARDNAQRNNITNARFVTSDAARIFAEVTVSGDEAAVIVDPPRKGCGDAFLSQLAAFGPATIVYVSCNPETLARDCDVLQRAGYQVEALQPFDMFPQTRHLECVAVLKRPRTSSP
ncbi:MAG: class I SAM-dependent RNA methyltransferase [Myxococcales bacterium]